MISMRKRIRVEELQHALAILELSRKNALSELDVITDEVGKKTRMYLAHGYAKAITEIKLIIDGPCFTFKNGLMSSYGIRDEYSEIKDES